MEEEIVSVGQGGPAPVHVTGPRAPKRTWWDLRNARIGAKVAMIVALPVAGLLVLGGLRILTSLQDALDAGQVQEQASLGVRASALVHQLQYERAIATDYLAGDRDAGQVFESEVAEGQEAVKAFRRAEARFVSEYGHNNATAVQLRTVAGRLDTLGDIRKSVLSDNLTAPGARERYTTLINDVLDLREGSAFGSADSELVKAVEAAAAVSRAKEFVSQERALLTDVLAEGSFGPGQYKDFVYTVAARDAALEQFDSIATPGQASRLQRILTNDAGRMERTAMNADGQGELGISPDQWSGAMQSSANGLRATERSLGDQVIDEAQDARVREARGAVIDTVLIALAILIGLRLTLSVARSMVRRLKTLRSTAIEVAEYSLPDVVQRLQESDAVVHVEDEVAPVEIDSRDEIGDLGRAFNAVHSEALRTAAEQAALRRNIATMFVNLARRSQTLVDRQLQLIDSLERREQDSERLENLFKLDHLATRMRRNDENLLVLAGQEIVRRWMQPVPLVDVLRAAAGEVEHYRRIDVTNVESSLSVVGQTVNDVVHLLAELLENATGYSPPQTRVTVSARLVTSHVLVEIGDNGIGMPPEQLAEANERLSRPPELDVALSKMMGLFVVGRLALRHGIKVQLRAAPQGGVIAMVMLPEHAIGRASSGGVGERSADSQGARSDGRPQGRPALAPEASGLGARPGGEPSPFAGRRPPTWGPAVP
ncbi:MAG: sensor histidine kinase, partial [Streptomycetales bacterium]